MKLSVLLLLATIAMIFPLSLVAGVYASAIHFTNPDSTAFDGSVTDGTGLRINFVLSDTASTVSIRIQNSVTNAIIQTINLTNRPAGWNFTIWDGTGAPAGSASYYVSMTATRTPRSATNYKLARFVFTNPTGFAIFSRGVDVVRDQTNRNFGFFYTSNAGLPVGRGIARYTAAADRAGTAFPNPYLTQSGVNTSGIGWSEDVSAPVHATIDDLGRVYASDFPRGEVWRMDNNTAVPKRIIRVPEPKGLAITGTGANRKIYMASAGNVVRANIGASDTNSTRLDTIVAIGGSVRDVIFDDEGFLYLNVRSGSGFDASPPGRTYRFDISAGPFPKTEFDALWIVDWTGLPIGLGHWSGTNLTSATDDIIYVSHRSTTTTDLPGVYRITQVTSISPVREHLFRPSDVPGGGGGDCSSRADLTVDPSGNVVFFENGNEEIIILEPPGSSPVSYITKSAVTFTLGSLSVELVGGTPQRYELRQNYPNPFNPTTNIEFSLLKSGYISLKVYDVLGKEVATLVDEVREAGNYRVSFDEHNVSSGTSSRYASGVYFYTLRSGDFLQTKKMLLLR